MCTSATAHKADKQRQNRILAGFVLLAAVCIAIANLYALFGHGIRSRAMDGMFLYPLCGGILYRVLGFGCPSMGRGPLHRLGFNLYCSGLSSLTVGGFLKGILDIAGTASDFQRIYMAVGWGFVLAGLLLFLWVVGKDTKASTDPA